MSAYFHTVHDIRNIKKIEQDLKAEDFASDKWDDRHLAHLRFKVKKASIDYLWPGVKNNVAPAQQPFVDGQPTGMQNRSLQEYVAALPHDTMLAELWHALDGTLYKPKYEGADDEEPASSRDEKDDDEALTSGIEKLSIRTRKVPDRGPMRNSLTEIEPGSDSDSSKGSNQSTYYEKEDSKETAYEDATVHYAACAIGWVVLKAPANQQPEGKPEGSKEAPADRQVTKPYVVEFSRDKAHLNYLPKGSACKIRAIDDGGLDLVKRTNVTEGLRSRVVLLEAKRYFNNIKEGKPRINNKLFGQLAREATSQALCKYRTLPKKEKASGTSKRYTHLNLISLFHLSFMP
ncbi:hypothetical protein EV127DRAFT_489915 [Xylaria flabelliformis]|nr:hypothetical protein EV127DRAFT_489915 [Xylaria flabelliformis]